MGFGIQNCFAENLKENVYEKMHGRGRVEGEGVVFSSFNVARSNEEECNK